MTLVLLSTLMPVAGQELTLQEQAKKIHHGSKVMVQLKNGNTVFGRLVEVTDSKLTLELAAPSVLHRDLLFQEISSIRRIREMPKPVKAIATVPLILLCGVQWIFNKNACDEL